MGLLLLLLLLLLGENEMQRRLSRVAGQVWRATDGGVSLRMSLCSSRQTQVKVGRATSSDQKIKLSVFSVKSQAHVRYSDCDKQTVRIMVFLWKVID